MSIKQRPHKVPNLADVKEILLRMLRASHLRHSEKQQMRYLPQSVKLEEAVSPYTAYAVMLVLSLCVVIFVIWASLTPIQEVAKAKGGVVSRGVTQIVQHAEGGTVTDILVASGDHVEAQDLLMRIDDTDIAYQLAQLRAQVQNLQLQHAHLTALLEGEDLNLQGLDFVTEDLQAQQQDLLASVKEARRAQLALAKDNEGRTQALLTMYRDEDLRALYKAQILLTEKEEAIRHYELKQSKMEIRSPISGRVNMISPVTIGGVVRKEEPLLEVAPDNQKLMVQARIHPRDIGHIKIGQKVRVKVSSYDFSRYGSVEGSIQYISAATSVGEDGEPSYQVDVGLSREFLGADRRENVLLPGMIAEVDVITGEKTIMAYLLRPIHVSLKLALSER